jgi:hypothetical protein
MPDWQDTINRYRALAGLRAAGEQPAWDAGLERHLTRWRPRCLVRTEAPVPMEVIHDSDGATSNPPTPERGSPAQTFLSHRKLKHPSCPARMA